MTREEAIERLKNTAWLGSNNDRESTEEAVRMAIEALNDMAERKDEPQTELVNDSQILVKDLVDDEFNPYDEECMRCKHLKLQCEFVSSYCKYEPKDETQTNADQHVESVDLISRQDAIDAIMGEPTDAHYPSWYADRIKVLPSADRSTEWIPFTKRPLTDEEKEEYPDWIYILDCPLPDDGQEILLSNGKYVWTDTFFNDDWCYLDGGDDIDEGMAWMPMPEPYKAESEDKE